MALFKFSQSKVNTFLRCREAYHLKYMEKLRRIKVKRPLMFGRIVHQMIEEDAAGGDPFKLLDKISLEDEGLWSSEKEMYGEIIQDIRAIMTEYFDYWHPRDLKLVSVDGSYAEHEFEIEVSGMLMTGFIDSLAKTPNKLKWLVEHKTFDKKPNDDHRWRNIQSSLYIRVLEMLGWMNPDGVAWNYIHSKAPSIPPVLKNGKLSQAQRIVTLPSVVRATLKQHNLKEADHQDLLKHAEGCRERYFQREFTPVSRRIVDKIFLSVIDTAREMSEYTPKQRVRNIGRHCEWCDYEPICRADLTGGDVDFVKEREYEKKQEEPRDKKKKPRRSKVKGKAQREASKRDPSVPKRRPVRKKRDRQDDAR